MDIETLEGKITKRASINVDARLRHFRDEVDNALNRLFGKQYYNVPNKQVAMVLCARATTGTNRKIEIDGQVIKSGDYPDSLCEDEQNKLRDEVMGTMDALQKLLMTPDDETPEKAGT